MELGSLIRIFENANPEATVVFDFCGAVPCGIDSWRGVYSDLALGWEVPERFNPRAKDLLPMLKEAVGKTFTGWKGGNFTMDEHTEVWVDNIGCCTCTSIVGVEFDGDDRLILTTGSE